MKEKKEDVVIALFNRDVVVMYDIDDPNEHLRPWENNGVFICDPDKNIQEPEIINIIEYLYAEGFIDDRRTPYEVLKDDM